MKAKKIISVLLALLMLLSSSVAAFAEEPAQESSGYSIQPRRYSYLQTFTVSMGVASNAITAKATVLIPSDCTATCKFYFDKSSDNSNFSQDFYLGSEDVEGGSRKTVSKVKSVATGYYYRVRIKINVYKNGTLVESAEDYTSARWI